MDMRSTRRQVRLDNPDHLCAGVSVTMTEAAKLLGVGLSYMTA